MVGLQASLSNVGCFQLGGTMAAFANKQVSNHPFTLPANITYTCGNILKCGFKVRFDEMVWTD